MGSRRYDKYCQEMELEYLEAEAAELEFQKAVEEDKKMTTERPFMTTETALEIVYQLAKQGALQKDEAEDSGMLDEYDRQQTALDTFEDFLSNNVFR